jgi:hypothetical protein
LSVQPCRRHKAIDRATNDIFEQRSALGHACEGIGPRKTKELAFASGHETRPEAIGRSIVIHFIAVVKAVKEDLASRFRPTAQARSERRSGDDWGISPVVGNDQQRYTISGMHPQQVEQPFDLALKAGRYVVHGCQEQIV